MEADGPGEVEVALKFVALGERAGEAESRALEVVKHLRHPNLLSLSGVWQAGEFLILGMELADRTLLDRFRGAVAQGSPGIPPSELLGYMADAARGIDFLNAPGMTHDGQETAGVQHRDIKPQNLLLVGGCVKVGDMGLARLVGQDGTGHSGSMTVAYAAPEFFAGQTSSRSDQYGLAVTYCQLRAGRLPFAGSAAQLVAGHLHRPPDLGMLPEAERGAVARALAKRPADRWPTCKAFVEALRDGASGEDAPTEVAEGDAVVAHPAPPRHTKKLVATGGLVLAAIAILALWGWPGTPEKGDAAGERIAPTDPEPAALAQDAPSFTNTLMMELVRIPAGKFVMGSPAGVPNRKDDEEEHAVEITKPFYLGVHEVTVGQFRRLLAATGHRTDAEVGGNGWGFRDAAKGFDSGPTYSWRNPGWAQTDRHPVANVSSRDAEAFCAWLSREEGRGYRLPTEAEWEYACRAGAKSPWHSGPDPAGLRLVSNGADLSLRARWPNSQWAEAWDDGHPFTSPVGSFVPNAWGLYDMLGNVWEWCADRYGRYDPLDMKDPRGPAEGDLRVRRGDSWYDPSQVGRSAYRAQGSAGAVFCNLGFRVACTAEGGPGRR